MLCPPTLVNPPTCQVVDQHKGFCDLMLETHTDFTDLFGHRDDFSVISSVLGKIEWCAVESAWSRMGKRLAKDVCCIVVGVG